jgi:SsrA-binding protein
MKIVSQNKKARFLYEIIRTYEAGIALLGSEVKSLRSNNASINDSYGRFIKNELFLINSHIAIYKESSYQNHDPKRMRKLLLHKAELARILPKLQEKNFTLIPLKIYINEKNKMKVEIALAKGKKLFDKRQTLKERDLEKKMSKEIKNF